MKRNLQLYRVPMIFFLLIFSMSFYSFNNLFVSQWSSFFFVLGLFSFTAENFKVRGIIDKNNPSQKKMTLLIYLLGIIAAISVLSLLNFTANGYITDDHYYYLILALLMINLIALIITIEWNSRGLVRKIFFLIIQLTIIAVITFVVFFVVGIGLSKETGPSDFGRIFVNMYLMGFLPILILLISPSFPVKPPYSFNKFISFIPAMMVLIFVVYSLLNPSPYQPKQFINYLEEHELMTDGQPKQNPQLNLQERQEFVDYSRTMAQMQLPPQLSLITDVFNYSKTYYRNEGQNEATFIEAFGFSPFSLMDSVNWQADYGNAYVQIELFDTYLEDILLEDIHHLHKMTLRSEFSLPETHVHSFKLAGEEFQIQAKINLNPDSFDISLLDSQGQVLQTIQTNPLMVDRLNSDSDYLDAEKLIFPFENDEHSGFLIIQALRFKPLNQDSQLDLVVALQDKNTQWTDQSIDIIGDFLTIEGDYEKVVLFKNKDFFNEEWKRSIRINNEIYQLEIIQNYKEFPLHISILNQDNEAVFSLGLDVDELHQFFIEDYRDNYRSVHYQDGDWEIELLLYDENNKNRGKVDGAIFIHQR